MLNVMWHTKGSPGNSNMCSFSPSAVHVGQLNMQFTLNDDGTCAMSATSRRHLPRVQFSSSSDDDDDDDQAAGGADVRLAVSVAYRRGRALAWEAESATGDDLRKMRW
jgi:hypothetical protein